MKTPPLRGVASAKTSSGRSTFAAMAALVIKTARRVISMVWLLGGIRCDEKQSLRHEADDDAVGGAGRRADDAVMCHADCAQRFGRGGKIGRADHQCGRPFGCGACAHCGGIALGETRRI